MGASLRVNINDCLIRDDPVGKVVAFDPGAVLKSLPSNITDQQHRIYVLLIHQHTMIEMKLDVFMSTDHKIRGDKLCIGSQKIPLEQMSLHVGFKIELEDLSDLMDIPVD
jgi:hypothetical protein